MKSLPAEWGGDSKASTDPYTFSINDGNEGEVKEEEEEKIDEPAKDSSEKPENAYGKEERQI